MDSPVGELLEQTTKGMKVCGVCRRKDVGQWLWSLGT